MIRSVYLLAFSILVIGFFAGSSCSKPGLSNTQFGNWIQAAPIGNFPRSNAVSFVIGDTAYVGLGYNETVPGNHRLKDFWSFSATTGWTQLPDYPGVPRSNAVGFSLDGYGYAGTGYDGTFQVYADFYQYDPALQKWSLKAPLPGGGRYDAVGFGLQGKGYVGTGFNNFWLNDFYQYDPGKDKWEKTPGTSGNLSKRRAASAFVFNNKAYLVGGSISGGMARDFWAFDPSQPAPWIPLNNITNTEKDNFDDDYTDIQREYGSAFVNGDQAYLMLGRNGSGGMVTSTWAYDIVNDRWSRRSPYPRSPRFGSVGFTVSGESFIGLGSTGNFTTFDDLDHYFPKDIYNSND
ncbi:Kelch repeat-containing protein [Flavitalea flava]